MTVISFCNIKGGCGKTTGAVTFASWLERYKQKKVHFVDANEQGSSSFWLRYLDTAITCSHITDPDKIIELLPELNEEYDFVVVDGVPEILEINKSLLCFSDISVSPIQPVGLDLEAFCSKTLRAIKLARKISRGLPSVAAAYLSRASVRSSSKEKAFPLLDKIPEIKLLRTIIHDRKVVGDCFTAESVIWDFKKNKTFLDSTQSAVKEFENLSEEIYGLLKEI
ncbi:AAA family ATPase [Scytonema sp. UIC 10036]|uniref:AAA family ATPase n=1 Tax=Scytonema sp. UIC 10036 TaxID=2304196 RepID=UPI0012DA0B41|nr:AAA family ATPase [Scytonema sp. UIC 10036]MUG95751.1 AAA family ATPase [Scytonema sp. UIC 10036]